VVLLFSAATIVPRGPADPFGDPGCGCGDGDLLWLLVLGPVAAHGGGDGFASALLARSAQLFLGEIEGIDRSEVQVDVILPRQLAHGADGSRARARVFLNIADDEVPIDVVASLLAPADSELPDLCEAVLVPIVSPRAVAAVPPRVLARVQDAHAGWNLTVVAIRAYLIFIHQGSSFGSLVLCTPAPLPIASAAISFHLQAPGHKPGVFSSTPSSNKRKRLPGLQFRV
jgi:hypothetical protein